jgi:anti-sigma factor RsiW
MAAMIDGRLPADRRAKVDAHLAVCSACRSELAATAALVDSAPSRRRIPVRWIASAAAAVLVLAVLPLVRSGKTNAPATGERAAASSPLTVTTVTPTSGMQAAVDSVVFAWRSLPGVTTYQLFVTDSVGTPVYTLKTGDTVVRPVANAPLSPGARYFWYVDALKSDGSSTASPQIGFSIRPR